MKAIKISQDVWGAIWRELTPDVCLKGGKSLYESLKCIKSMGVAQNALSSLKSLGLLSQNGQLTHLGIRWVDEATHVEACRELYNSFFPEDLRALYRDGNEPQRAEVSAWLMSKAGMPEYAAQKTATFFSALHDDVFTPGNEGNGFDSVEVNPLPSESIKGAPQEYSVSIAVTLDELPEIISILGSCGKDIRIVPR